MTRLSRSEHRKDSAGDGYPHDCCGHRPDTIPSGHRRLPPALQGDVRISLDGLDIDVVPPTVKPPADQVNLYVDINPPQDVFGDPGTLAEWTGKTSPTATDCAAAVQQARALGQPSVTARTGDRVCIVTQQGTIGFLVVTKKAVDIYTGLFGHMKLWKQT
ncbi:hypothetical protein [Streptacidiphilus sp. MAP5-52]|uniref:hypothetical protein n=1 Tax=Streptacidiphilus sp. MAP5-52 TaxID=3156267 RepID=UPI003510F5E2